MKKLKWLKFLIAGIIVTAGVMVCNNTLDNDSWYIFAEGREIIENGVYHTDQLSMHDDLEVTVQNYGFSVIHYTIYTAFGEVGVYLAMLVLNLVLCFLIYKICILISNKNVNLSLIIMILTDLLLARWFLVTRAQVVSYCILMLVIYLLELYIKTDKTKFLWWIPILSLIQINLHASLWPMILLVAVVYVIDLVAQPKKKKWQKIWPVLLTILGSFLVGFLNPYGARMMTFILTSYGISEANAVISELRPFDLGQSFNIILYGVIAITMMLYIFGKNKNIRLRWLLLLFGFLALGLNTVKGMSHLILVLLFPLAAVYKDVRIEKIGTHKLWWMMASWVGILAVCLIITVAVVRIPEIINGPSMEMIMAMDAIDEDVGDGNKKDLKIYTAYNDGGYAEYRGYKPYLDPRMEVFIKSNNGKEDIFQEWYKLENGKIKETDFLAKYDFDYLVVQEEQKLYEDLGDEYEMIFEKDDGEDYFGVRVYKKLDV